MPLKLDTGANSFAADFNAFLGAKRDSDVDVDAIVGGILAEVRSRGDAAVIDYTRRFDKLELTPSTLRIPAAAIAAPAKSCRTQTLAAPRPPPPRHQAFHPPQGAGGLF